MRWLAIAAMLVFPGSVALGGENHPLGTWKLKSLVSEVLATGERTNLFGDDPQGYLSYAPDGRMYAIIIRGDRISPRDQALTDEDRAKLHRSMIAYAGTYAVEGDKVTHRLDITWNQIWMGTELVRYYKLNGNMLVIKTAPAKNPVDGRETQSVLVWEKVGSGSR